MRFLKAREGNVTKAYDMVTQKLLSISFVLAFFFPHFKFGHLNNWIADTVKFQLVDCLKWRVQNNIDDMLNVGRKILLLIVFVKLCIASYALTLI